MNPDAARLDLEAWRASFPDDPYRADRFLPALVHRSLDQARARSLDQAASAFARQVIAEVAPLAERTEHRLHLPELARHDRFGRVTEEVRFDPDYHGSGHVVWESGIVAHSGVPGRAFEQGTLLYLLSLEGETGHACPATCTIGLARALRRRAEPEVRDRFLPPLLELDYGRAERASQFLTEIQGGSDVGANAAVAEPAGDGTYRVTGEKWFCSVADAQQFLLTARVPGAPDGTKGLGCFVMPRFLDGAPNGFRIRRLKEKLGTRGLASAEIDLDGAVAWPIGPVEDGFKTAVGVVLNTSRWLTAVGGAGMMWRSYLEAAGFARHRRAFGRPIGDFPLVRRTLAGMKVQWLGALHAVWVLTGLEDAIDAGTAGDEEVALHRFLVNATKYEASWRATSVVRDAIEVLGGNGTIEEFSVLPRLYRDAMVYESWEGTHNVLVTQVLNDCRRLDLLSVLDGWLTGVLEAVSSPAGKEAAATALAALDDEIAGARRAVGDPGYGAAHFRTHLGRIMLVVEVASMLDSLEHDGPEELGPVADLLARLELESGYRPEADPAFTDRVDAALAGDLSG
ncbi:MAG: acyl-CoA dehydrogenase family protein [Acidimicrobiia bacterium]|nr:acyl-CoA dehydrogenase family protein [Acidimicrobiia bacterium]